MLPDLCDATCRSNRPGASFPRPAGRPGYPEVPGAAAARRRAASFSGAPRWPSARPARFVEGSRRGAQGAVEQQLRSATSPRCVSFEDLLIGHRPVLALESATLHLNSALAPSILGRALSLKSSAFFCPLAVAANLPADRFRRSTIWPRPRGGSRAARRGYCPALGTAAGPCGPAARSAAPRPRGRRERGSTARGSVRPPSPRHSRQPQTQGRKQGECPSMPPLRCRTRAGHGALPSWDCSRGGSILRQVPAWRGWALTGRPWPMCQALAGPAGSSLPFCGDHGTRRGC